MVQIHDPYILIVSAIGMSESWPCISGRWYFAVELKDTLKRQNGDLMDRSKPTKAKRQAKRQTEPSEPSTGWKRAVMECEAADGSKPGIASDPKDAPRRGIACDKDLTTSKHRVIQTSANEKVKRWKK